MYKINRSANKITELTKVRFKDYGIRERQHLQEWLANEQGVFGGEELLIIAKEFSGFSDTNERLDLLALDKDGNVVVIENKLDDSGRNVTWQALKYASYCSTLKKENILKIYQEYLDRYTSGAIAVEKLSEFYDEEFEAMDSFNISNSQRIIFVANEYRKEVTSTIMWLLNFKLRVQCFKVTPFALEDDLFLTLEQIIPQKDIEDYIIKMAEKSREEMNTQEGNKDRHNLRLKFWNKILPLFKGKTQLFQSINPTKDHWLTSTLAGVKYTIVITKNNCSVLIEFSKSDVSENKHMFDSLLKSKEEIETKFGHPLNWERLDDKISSRVSYSLQEVNYFNENNWGTMQTFLIENIIKLEKAVEDPLAKIKR
ncbi:DUF4268 domain-containing protein [Nodularia spumigena CS-584]|uniref:DUF4268 domain-containing protein n=1 Tax=Nodularia spumigena TaxID=70799 RepID=UPI000DB0376B|nr:DUF4268 domain-containing protein [Nodularia spumigena]MDB9382287.1 DUF4268 domain-containing protein [Nodularia spumigena CS-584]PZR24216.1 MAG: hypothetical protein DI539_00630 [Flavobacterium psychrophilum]